jgi:hypothetical protein
VVDVVGLDRWYLRLFIHTLQNTSAFQSNLRNVGSNARGCPLTGSDTLGRTPSGSRVFVPGEETEDYS